MIEYFEAILVGYQNAVDENFALHPLGTLFRQNLPNALAEWLSAEQFIVKGSAGAGNWAATPWVAILDIIITTTPQSGYYPVFLFKDDMSGFYLSLNQGVTKLRDAYKSSTKSILNLKSENFRAQIENVPDGFNFEKISIKVLNTTRSEYPRLYEYGNIVSKFYSLIDLPTDEQLRSDLNAMLAIYQQLSIKQSIALTEGEEEIDEQDFKGFEDINKFRFHKRVERNASLAKKAKKVHGYKCKVCKMDFKKVYGIVGKNFIEAHHLRPVSSFSEKVKLDVRNDFTVLCANCHRMIHRMPDTSDLEALKMLVNRK